VIGRLLGGYFGYALTAPLGYGLLGFGFGFWLGGRFERSIAQHGPARTHFFFTQQHNETQAIFFHTAFAVMGYVAKSDGVVSEQEIHVAESFMRQLNMSATSRKAAIQAFQEGKAPGFDLDQTLYRLRHVCHGQVILLRLFLDMQTKAASVDGLSREKVALLNHIYTSLGAGGFYQHHAGQQQNGPSTTNNLAEAYRTLEVSEKASHDEIKKAYRRLLGKHHPDRLIAKGLPQDMIQLANDKTVAIKKAYEQIKAHRRF
jgi:DnaJ like chaperone protein